MNADVLVVGAGIVGAACARELHAAGMEVAMVEANFAGGGVTAAGMGHLLVLDESEEELALTTLSLHLWREYLEENPGAGEFTPCGTLWVAEDDAQAQRARVRATRLRQHGWMAEDLGPDDMQRVEPLLRRGIAGGLRVMSDGVVYAPVVTHAMCAELAQRGCDIHLGRRAVALKGESLTLDDGTRLAARHIVIATGPALPALLPDVPVFPRKGHLAITDRYPGLLNHAVVSMRYGQTSGGAAGFAVATNIQPRPTGQWLVGASRQEGISNLAVDRPVLQAVLHSAIELVPALAGMRIIRTWTGLRPATPDGHPLIGPHASLPGVWLAAGHEGLGITTCFATARLLADQILGRNSEISLAPYLPSRFAAGAHITGSAHAH